MRNCYVDRYPKGHSKEGKISCIYSCKQPHHGNTPEILLETDKEIIDYNNELKEEFNNEKIRIHEINSEKEISGLSGISIDEAKLIIEQLFDEVSTVAQLKAATIKVLEKILPYLIE